MIKSIKAILAQDKEMKLVPGCKNIRLASRTNQRIIMLNKWSYRKLPEQVLQMHYLLQVSML